MGAFSFSLRHHSPPHFPPAAGMLPRQIAVLTALRCPKKSSHYSFARFFRPLRILRLASSATGGARLRIPIHRDPPPLQAADLKVFVSPPHSSPPLRRGQGWWFAVLRSSAAAIKMPPQATFGAILRAVRIGIFQPGKIRIRIQRSQASKGFAKGKARFPFALFCFLLQEQKEVPAGQAQGRPCPR